MLYGGAGDDRLVGGAGDDYLFGNEGSDELLGGPGRDVLRGNSGPDYLDGGADEDLIFYQDDDVIVGGSGFDTLALQDWRTAKIDLRSGKIQGIESIDLRNQPNQDVSIVDHLVISALQTDSISDNASLYVRADPADQIFLLDAPSSGHIYVLIGSNVDGEILTGSEQPAYAYSIPPLTVGVSNDALELTAGDYSSSPQAPQSQKPDEVGRDLPPNPTNPISTTVREQSLPTTFSDTQPVGETRNGKTHTAAELGESILTDVVLEQLIDDLLLTF